MSPPDPLPVRMAAAQNALFSFITGRRIAVEGGAPLAESLVVSDHRASAQQRLHVYAHMYLDRLVEVLEAEFPRLARALGAESFATLAAAYAAEHPSTNPSLRFFGQSLPAFLRGHKRTVSDALWPAPLALLEWTRADVFDDLDESLLSVDQLRAVTPEEFAGIPLQLIRASRIIELDGRIPALWDALGSTNNVDGDAAVPVLDVEPAARGEECFLSQVLVWRQGTVVYHRVLDSDEGRALRRLADGTTFGAICEDILATLPPPQASARAFAWLATWTADELLVGY